jgi:hypothetical protein
MPKARRTLGTSRAELKTGQLAQPVPMARARQTSVIFFRDSEPSRRRSLAYSTACT